MVDSKQKDRQQHDALAQYASPKLKVFGPVGALTQSGTGVVSERMLRMMRRMRMQNRP